MRYEPDECAYCGAETWCEYRAKNGKPQCRGCKWVRFYERVLYPPIGYTMLPWVEECLRGIFGRVDMATGERLTRTAYISVASQNGKSFLSGGLPLGHLIMETEIEPDPLHAIGAAAALKQAGIVYRAALRLLKGNSLLEDKLRPIESTKRIVRRDGRGFYEVVSGDGDVNDGVSPSLLVVDELHRWTTAKQLESYRVLKKGRKARHQPVMVEPTTAGQEHRSPLWEEEDRYAKQLRDGVLENKSYFVFIRTADPDKVRDDPEHWKSKEARVAANPSHEDNGGFVKDSAIVEELDAALAKPNLKPSYIRFQLNLMQTQTVEGVIDMEAWKACGGGVDLRDWPEYDLDLLISKWGLAERPCVAGLDIGSTIDLAALTLLFPTFPGADIHTLLSFLWMPEERVAERQERDRVPYSEWVRRGFVSATPGNAVDVRAIRERVKWAAEMFELREVGYDPWNARALAMDLVDDGIHCVEVRQGFKTLSTPTKTLLGMHLDKKLRHGNNPAVNYCASCLALKDDGNDNVRPEKPQRAKSSKRIDPIVAAIIALARLGEQPPQPQKPSWITHGAIMAGGTEEKR